MKNVAKADESFLDTNSELPWVKDSKYQWRRLKSNSLASSSPREELVHVSLSLAFSDGR
jgi:hypothetical protein